MSKLTELRSCGGREGVGGERELGPRPGLLVSKGIWIGGARAGEAMRRVEKGRREGEPQGTGEVRSRQLPWAEDQSQEESVGVASRLAVGALTLALSSHDQ